MEYLHRGRARVVSTPFPIDSNIHVRIAVNGRPFDPIVYTKPDWERLEKTAPDAETLWGLIASDIVQLHSLTHDQREIEQWKKPYDPSNQPKWMQEALEVWGANGRI